MNRSQLSHSLLKLAVDLADRGYHKEAAQLDKILEKVADERKFDIDVLYDVSVSKQDYQKSDEPPVQTHKAVSVNLVVRPVEGGTVVEKPVMQKALKARNLDQARAAIKPFVDQAKAKYAPASSDETIRYIPV